MKRTLRLAALVVIVLTSACALPYPNNAPLQSQGGSEVATQPSGLAVPSNPPPQPGSQALSNPIPPDATRSPTEFSAQVYVPNIVTSNDPSAATIYPAPEDATATASPTPELPTPSPTQASTDITRLPPYEPHTGETLAYQDWQQWPVLPVVSQRAKEIYQRGLADGTDPGRFSKIGDCQSIRQYFLGYFDAGNNEWRLGDNYSKYKSVLENFNGSYTRVSAAVRTGFNVASVLSAINADPNVCNPGETPLQCEFRIWNPSIVVISMETWTANRPTAAYEGYLRKIVDFVIAHNVVPILATKADNLEGDNSINQMIARVAYEYDIPLWNFWAASYPLPSHGLSEDGFHLTNGPSQLTGDGLQIGWSMRNYTALQAIDKVWREIK